MWLEGNRFDATPDESVTHIMYAGKSFTCAGCIPVRKRCTSPKDLCRRCCAGPHSRIKVFRTRLLSPEQMLTTKDEMRLVRTDVRQRVERVCLLDISTKVISGETKRQTFCHDLNGSHHELPFTSSPSHSPAPQSR
jgi:hypothetical protein